MSKEGKESMGRRKRREARRRAGRYGARMKK